MILFHFIPECNVDQDCEGANKYCSDGFCFCPEGFSEDAGCSLPPIKPSTQTVHQADNKNTLQVYAQHEQHCRQAQHQAAAEQPRGTTAPGLYLSGFAKYLPSDSS